MINIHGVSNAHLWALLLFTGSYQNEVSWLNKNKNKNYKNIYIVHIYIPIDKDSGDWINCKIYDLALNRKKTEYVIFRVGRPSWKKYW